MENKEVVFKGKVVRCTYNSEEYKVYALNVDTWKYPNIKLNKKYNNAVITGNLHVLSPETEYEITAIEVSDKYGISYEVVNIKRDKPQSEYDFYIFLSEILTKTQAENMYNAYPDIVNMIIEGRDNEVNLNNIKGVGEVTFEKIKQKIIENFALLDFINEFQGLLTMTMIKKLYQEYLSIEKIREELQKNPYKCLCKISQVGFKTADEILLEMDKISKLNVQNGKEPILQIDYDLKSSEQRCLACILYLLVENESNGNTKMDIVELKAYCDKLVPACCHHFVTIVKGSSDLYYDKETRFIARKKTYEIEEYIAKCIKEGLKCNTVWDYDLKEYSSCDGINLTEEQIESIENLCKYNISLLIGFSGSGKSQTTTSIIKLLLDKKKSFRLAAPTGKASKVLSGYTKQNATTIHRLLGYIPFDIWYYNEENKLDTDVLIIDEFSMVDIYLFKRVLSAIDFNRTKLLIVGDAAQIPSVSCGNLLHDFMLTKLIPTTVLTHIFRYGEGGLMKVATDVRNCIPYLKDVALQPCTYFGQNKDYAFIKTDLDNLVKGAVALYQKLLSTGYSVEDISVLTTYNKGNYGTIALNNKLQKVANSNYGKGNFIKHGEVTYYEGDLVIQKINNYHAILCDKDETTFIANGETGVITEIGFSYMTIDFDGVKVMYDKESLSTIGLGYCISIHRIQGSQNKVIILLTPSAHSFMLNSNLIYVGLTRMKEKCYHLGNDKTVNIAVKKKENFNRNTFMKKLLLTGDINDSM